MKRMIFFKARIIYFTVFWAVLFIAGCYLEPGVNKIDSPQMKPWSPWPMRGHFFDHTGRSPFKGASEGKIKWTVKTD